MTLPRFESPLHLRPLTDSASLIDDAAALRRRAHRDGYLFFRSLLTPQPVLALRAEVLALCESRGWLAAGAPLVQGRQRAGLRLGAFDEDFLYLQGELARSAAFAALREERTILDVLAKVFGAPAQGGLGSICRVVSPGVPELTTLPHQDRHYARAGVDLWTVWIPLGDCPVEYGGLALAAGSHRRGPQPHDLRRGHLQGVCVKDDVAWHGEDYACGDVLAFHGLTLHRACDNVTHDRLRISVDHRYQPRSGPRLVR